MLGYLKIFITLSTIRLIVSSTRWSCFLPPTTPPTQDTFPFTHCPDAPQSENKQTPLLIWDEACC